jgi:hypothetical protein
MSKARRHSVSLPLDDTLFGAKQRKLVPHEFVLDAIASLSPRTRPMFACLAVYVQDKIVLILRDKQDGTAGNGVWLANYCRAPQESAPRVPEHGDLFGCWGRE